MAAHDRGLTGGLAGRQIRSARLLEWDTRQTAVVAAVVGAAEAPLQAREDRSAAFRQQPPQPDAIRDHGGPEHPPEFDFAGFVSEHLLSEQCARPAPEEREQMQSALSYSPPIILRGRLVQGIRDESGRARHEIQRKHGDWQPACRHERSNGYDESQCCQE